MYEFLILGLIPGTEVQVSFGAWIFISAAIVVFLNRKYLRIAVAIAHRIWALRYHVAAIISLETLSLRRKLND